MVMAVVLLLVFFAGFTVIQHFKPGSWISAAMIMPHVAIPPDPVNFIFRNLMISPPHNPLLRLAVYQFFIFYQVVGCWGLFVYLLFGIMIRRFVKLPYLVAGMVVVPLLTVFNPLTMDLIVRMGQSAALYRFIYLIPLPFVGGYLLVHFWDKAREWFGRMRATPAESVSPIWPRRSWLNLVGSYSGPCRIDWPDLSDQRGRYLRALTVKIYTLRKMPAGNDYHLYDDLGKIMAKYNNKIILSDGWTAGFLWNYSPKNTYGWLMWFRSLNPEKDQPDPYAWRDLRNRGLIIVNCRDGAPSITGKIARHWPDDFY